jgi:spore germination cell wall hydrolase CwlJ-like protein
MRSFQKVGIGLIFYALVIAAGLSGIATAADNGSSGPAFVTMPLALPDAADTPAYSDSELRCVQRTVFGEARNQSYATQVAVAASVVTRSLSGTYPANLCEIVKQDHQYIGYSGGVSLSNDIEASAWDTAGAAARHAALDYGSLPEQYRQTMFFRTAGSPGANDLASKRSYRVLGRLDSMIFYGKSA